MTAPHHVPGVDGLTGRVPRWVLGVSMAGTGLIDVGAFWLSATALTNLAQRAGLAWFEAWMWPVIVDGMMIVSTVAIVALRPHGRRAVAYPWMLLIAGSGVSVVANTAHALVTRAGSLPAPLAGLMAAVPPLVLLASTHLTVELARRSGRPEIPVAAAAPTAQAMPAEKLLPASPRARALSGAPTSADLTALVARPPVSVEAPASEIEPAKRTEKELERRRRARQLRTQGLSNAQIAAELGVHKSTVGRWLSPSADTT
ncbi:DUF2637 domain-containing protein [Gryllotalpicola reticulitermitis]|uniref:DUF2637 domain-containing protein n=1 Tax=Gryllotalpicola reticulitermitis TaxID=1184153 RepID=A0ABV8Q9N5_9MICO